MTTDTLDPQEKAHFDALAGDWWQEGSQLDSLRAFNKARVSFILKAVREGLGHEGTDGLPLAGLSVLDVGCGGGILSESLAKLGATVTGLDASEAALDTARDHADQEGLEISYQLGQIETLPLPKKGKGYDLVIASEVIEHVTDPASFVQCATQQVAKDGLFIATTLNRTARAAVLGIVAAEYVLRIVPKGTHHWRKFVKPSELAAWLRDGGFDLGGLSGARYNPLTKMVSLSARDLSVNYLLWAKRA